MAANAREISEQTSYSANAPGAGLTSLFHEHDLTEFPKEMLNCGY
jgi:hypothetical protein